MGSMPASGTFSGAFGAFSGASGAFPGAFSALQVHMTCIGHNHKQQQKAGYHKSLNPATRRLGSVPRGTKCNTTQRPSTGQKKETNGYLILPISV